MISSQRLSASSIIIPFAFVLCLIAILLTPPAASLKATATSESKPHAISDSALRTATSSIGSSLSVPQDCELPRFTTVLRTVRTDIDSIEVAWAPPAGFEPQHFFLIKYQGIANGDPEVLLPPILFNGSSLYTQQIIRLVPDKAYEISIKMVCGGGLESDWNTLLERTDTLTCEKPELRPITFGSTTATATWRNPDGSARRYRVTLKDLDHNAQTVQVVVGNSYRFDPLLPMTNYQVVVEADCSTPPGRTLSGPVESETFKTLSPDPPPSPCQQPQGLRVPEFSAIFGRAKWNNVMPISKDFPYVRYWVEYEQQDGAKRWTALSEVNNWPMRDLTPDTPYKVRVIAQCQLDARHWVDSPPTDFLPFSTLKCVKPLAPFAEMEDITYNSAKVKWGIPDFEEYSATLEYRKVGDSEWLRLPSTDSGKITIGGDANPLFPNTDYEFRVVTNCGRIYTSEPAGGGFTTKPCPRPTGLRAPLENRTVTSAKLIWDDVADRYDLRLRLFNDPLRPDCTDDDDTCWRYIRNINRNEKAVEGLLAGKDYKFQVASYCDPDSRPTAWSFTQSFKTRNCDGAIPMVSVEDIRKNSARITWDEIRGVQYYLYQYRKVVKGQDEDEGWSELSAPQLGTEQTISDLTKCEKYEVRVRSSCSAICDPATSPTPCPPPALSDWGFDGFKTTCEPCDAPLVQHGEPNCSTLFIYNELAPQVWEVRWATKKRATGRWQFRWRECGANGCPPGDNGFHFIDDYDRERDQTCFTGENDKPHTDYYIDNLPLEVGRQYEVGVRYRCENGEWSGWSGQVKTLRALSVSLLDVAATSATLSWEPAPDASGYVVSYGVPGEEAVRAITVDANQQAATVEGLSPETGYDIRVKALLPDDSTVPTGYEVTTGAGKCSYSVNPMNASVGAAGGSGDININAAIGCSWMAASDSSWITIVSETEGRGEGTISYMVATNPVAETRVGSITVAGIRITISQAGNVSTNPVPRVGLIAPESAIVGSGPIHLAVNGSGFTSNSVVRVNGSDRLTTFQNAGLLNAVIPSSDLGAMRTFGITVFNPAPGGGTSNAVSFAVTSATGCARYAPTVTISPTDQRGHRSEQLNYRVSITNNDSPQCGSGSFDVIPTFPTAGWGQSPTSMGFSIPSGETATRDVLIWSAPSAPYATHTIHQTATRLDGPSGSGSATYTVYSLLPPDMCGRATPTIAISPADQQGMGGQYLTYRVAITNNDLPACGVMDFDVIPSLPDGGWIHSPTSLGFSILPGQTAWRDVTVASAPGAAFAPHVFTETVSSWVGHSATGQATYTVYDPMPPDTCGRANPTVTVTPNYQSGTQAQTLSYLVTVRNNDDPRCAGSNFTVRPTLPAASSGRTWVHVPQDYFTIFAPPGQSGSREIFVTSASLASMGEHSITWTASHTRYNSGAGQAVFNVIPYPTGNVQQSPSLAKQMETYFSSQKEQWLLRLLRPSVSRQNSLLWFDENLTPQAIKLHNISSTQFAEDDPLTNFQRRYGRLVLPP
jgi:Fibronectin type III domain